MKKYSILIAFAFSLLQNINAQIIVKDAIIYSPYGSDAVYKIDLESGKLESVLGLKENLVWATANNETGKLYVCGNNYAYKIDVASFKVEKEVMYFPMLEKEEHHKRDPNLIPKNPRISSTGKIVYVRNEKYLDIEKKEFYNKKKLDAFDYNQQNWKPKHEELLQEMKDLSEESIIEQPYSHYKVFDMEDEKTLDVYSAFHGHRLYVNGNTLYILEEEVRALKDYGEEFGTRLIMYDRDVNRIHKLTEVDLNTLDNKSLQVDLNVLTPIVDEEYRAAFFEENVFDQLMIEVQDGRHAVGYDRTTAAIIVHHEEVDLGLGEPMQYETRKDRFAELGVDRILGNHLVDIQMTPPPYAEAKPYPDYPVRSDFKKQKHWIEAMEANNRKVQEYNLDAIEVNKTYSEWSNNLDKNKIVISDKSSNEVVKEISNVYFYKPVDEKHILVVRSYEYELFDVENLQTVWTCELDF